MGIRAFEGADCASAMQIWLDANLDAHSFIPKAYWLNHYEAVKNALPKAEVYVYVNPATNQGDGFIGLSEDYIEGLFVKAQARSNGIGRQLLDYAKGTRKSLSLCVYQKNTRALQFYRREGFTVQSKRRDKGTGEPDALMVWSVFLRGD